LQDLCSQAIIGLYFAGNFLIFVMAVRLSVNINKIATLRNARGGNTPDVLKTAVDIERFGAQGITVHPRPDERHIRRSDVYELKNVISTEFNIEGYPSEDFIAMVLDIKPGQVTLVPDPPDVLTSNNGWDTRSNQSFLKAVVAKFTSAKIRTSIFLNPDPEMIESAAATGTDRIELYTEAYASQYADDRERAVLPYRETALAAVKAGIGVNAGHDLSLLNLKYFVRQVPGILEVSIGHALISDALYFGLDNSVKLYLRELEE
jgi:pyridoxine 5-phosphate synthase